MAIEVAGDGFYWSVSCATGRFCAAFSPVDTIVYGPSGWGHPARRNLCTDRGCGTGEAAISCASDRFCAFIDVWGYAYTYNGHSWSKPVAVDPASYAEGNWQASCPTAGYCVAVNPEGFVTLSAGKWGQIRPLYSHGVAHFPEISSLSCPTVDFCAGGAGGGGVLTFNGASWSKPFQLSPRTSKQPVQISVSCPTDEFCAALDTSGNAYTFNGARWTGADHIGTSNEGNPGAIACASSKLCLAVDDKAGLLVFQSGRWTAQKGVAASTVACTAGNFCMVFTTGDYYTYS